MAKTGVSTPSQTRDEKEEAISQTIAQVLGEATGTSCARRSAARCSLRPPAATTRPPGLERHARRQTDGPDRPLAPAEALVEAGASRTGAGAPLRAAYDVAPRLGAKPPLQELELLGKRE